MDGKTIDTAHSALHYRLHELELLCLHPLLFHNEITFEVVHRLKGKLEYFHSLLGKGAKEA